MLQNTSHMAGNKKGMDDERFLPFLDMVKILNFLQAEQHPQPLFLFENTWPGMPGQYPVIDKAAELVESFLGAPIVMDAADLGSAAHRVRLFWTNWCRPEILQSAIPTDILPNPPLEDILHDYHVSSIPSRRSKHPFANHKTVNTQRVCLPTLISYPKSHAFRQQANKLTKQNHQMLGRAFVGRKRTINGMQSWIHGWWPGNYSTTYHTLRTGHGWQHHEMVGGVFPHYTTNTYGDRTPTRYFFG